MNKNIKSGIYQFRNIINNKKYIGSTFDLKDRYKDHIKFLRKNQHHSIKFQRAFNKYGKENFIFEVLEYVFQLENESKKNFKKRLVEDREQHYLDTILFASENNSKFHKLGYNICRKTDSQLGIKRTKKQRKNRSIIQKELWKDEQYRKLMILKMKDRKKVTQETLDKMSKSMIGKNKGKKFKKAA